MPLDGLFLMVSLACFLVQSRNYLLMGGTVPHEPLSKKNFHRLAYRQILWRHFPNGFLFPDLGSLGRFHGRQRIDPQKGENENPIEIDVTNLDQTLGSMMPGGIIILFSNILSIPSAQGDKNILKLNLRVRGISSIKMGPGDRRLGLKGLRKGMVAWPCLYR